MGLPRALPCCNPRLCNDAQTFRKCVLSHQMVSGVLGEHQRNELPFAQPVHTAKIGGGGSAFKQTSKATPSASD